MSKRVTILFYTNNPIVKHKVSLLNLAETHIYLWMVSNFQKMRAEINSRSHRVFCNIIFIIQRKTQLGA